jgi:hypothetical protein
MKIGDLVVVRRARLRPFSNGFNHGWLYTLNEIKRDERGSIAMILWADYAHNEDSMKKYVVFVDGIIAWMYLNGVVDRAP